jgi:hypothetical protein
MRPLILAALALGLAAQLAACGVPVVPTKNAGDPVWGARGGSGGGGS